MNLSSEAPRDPSKSHLKTIALGGGVTMLGLASSGLLQYGYNVILARTYGPELTGIFVFVMSMVSIFSIIGQLGAQELVLRFIPAFRAREDSALEHGVLVFGLGLALVGTITLSLAGALFAVELAERAGKPEAVVAIYLGLLVVPVLALIEVSAAALRGYLKLGQATLLADFGIPFVTFVVTVIALVSRLSLEGLLMAFSAGIFLWTSLSLYLLLRASQVSGAWKRIEVRSKEWFAFSGSVIFLDITRQSFTWLDTLMLGFVGTTREVAIYFAALRTALLINIFLVAMNAVLAPLSAELWAKRDREGLQNVFQITTRWTWLGALPLAIIPFILNKELMSIFGDAYQTGGLVLSIVLIGRLVNALTGGVGRMLMMTGHQKVEMVNTVVTLIVSFVGMAWAAKAYGMLGVAVVNSLVISVANIVKLIQVKILLDVQPFRRDYWKLIAAALVASLAGMFLHPLLARWNTLVNIAGVSVVVLLVFALIYLLAGLSGEEMVLVRKLASLPATVSGLEKDDLFG